MLLLLLASLMTSFAIPQPAQTWRKHLLVWVSLVPLLGAGGCGWGPGMRIDEGAIKSRGRAAGDPRFDLVPITPAVITQQHEQLRTAATKRTPDPLAGTAKSYEYRVATPDVLSVTVWEHPELTIPAGQYRADTATGNPVMIDGNIFYPHAGLVPVAGKTLPEIRDILTKRLSKVLEKPQLDVRVAAFRAYKVMVTGEVKAAATLPLTDIPLHALDAVNLSGGATPEADLSRVILTRDGKPHILDLRAALEEADFSQNWLLVDGDLLHVPDRSLDRVFVIGEVKQPTTRYLRKGRLTLADALSESGWLEPESSNASGVYVIRGQYEKPQVFRLDAESPDALLLATAFPLRPLDVVFVSTHRLTQWNRIVAQLMPTINAVTQPALTVRGYFPLVPVAQ